MYVVTVRFRIAEGQMPDFLRLIRENARTSVAAEPGCGQFDVCVSPHHPDVVFLYEIYRDRRAFDEHVASAHFKTFDKASAALVKDKAVEIFARVEPSAIVSQGSAC